MIKYYIDTELTRLVKNSKKFNELSDVEHVRLYNEIKNATLQGIDDKLYNDSINKIKGINKSNSLLLWVLDIVEEKPLGLQKISSPGSYADIDTDVPQGERSKIINYIKSKYGEDKVTQIGTFGTLAAKNAIRSSARALGYSVEEGDFVSKLIPNEPGITIEQSINANPSLQDILSKEIQPYFKILTTAQKLEGLPSSLGMHASGILISDISIQNYFPLMISKKDGEASLSQVDAKDAEANFVLKFDILGLSTLDIISETCKLIKKHQNIDLHPYSINVNDESIYTLLNNGHTTLIFQLDGTASAYIPKVKPFNIDEISSLTSILRPGALAMGMVDNYINAKFHNNKYQYNITDQKLLQKVWDICNNSYGLMIYQENVISCFTDIAGFDEVAGDNSRRALGKKNPEEMAKLKIGFISGGVKNGYNEKDLEILFDQLAGFASYGFNSSHAYGYSYITAITAYLSANYPLEFFTAAMTINSGCTDDIRRYIKAAKERNINLLSPDINKSEGEFVIKDQSIIFGLNAIKGVGPSISKKIMSRKPKKGYISLGHFIKRNIDIINSKILESYTKAGCFKSFGYNKESILISIPYILDFISILRENSKYNTIFDISEVSLDDFINSCIIKYSNKEDSLSYEIDSIGLYINTHPMDIYELKGVDDPSRAKFYYNNEDFMTIGCLSGIDIRKTKAKTNMCKFNITTGSFSLPCIVFPKTYSRYINNNIIAEGRMVLVSGKIKIENENEELIVNNITDDIDKFLKKKNILQKNIYRINNNLSFVLE